jgi:hypothetical protein
MQKAHAVIAAGLVLTVSIFKSEATVLFSDDFNSYVNGNLAGLTANATGQGNWAQDNSSATTPIQVNNGTAVLGTSGQDVYKALATPYSLVDGSTFYIGAELNFTSAGTGDYFLHFSSPAGTTSLFQERLFAKSTTGGFLLGFADNTGGTTAYGTGVLSFGTTYNVIMAYTSVAGALNDTFAMYVDPTDLSIEGNNSAYLTTGYIGTGAELTSVAALDFRQGSAGAAPALSVDSLVAGTTFGDVTSVAPVPEPSTLAFAMIGGLGCLFAMRRNKR